MNKAHCRISRVRFKDGREIILPRNPSEDWTPQAKDLQQQLSDILAWWGEEISGFYIIVWDEYGEITTGCRFNDRVIPPHLFPAFISEIVRDRTITEDAVRSIVDNARRPPPAG